MQSFTLFYGTSIIILLLVSVSKSHGLLEQDEAVCPAERGAVCALYRQHKALDVRSHRLLQVRTVEHAVITTATRRDVREHISSLAVRHYDKDNQRLDRRTTQTNRLLDETSGHHTIRERVLSQRVSNRDTIVRERDNSRQFNEKSVERQRLDRHVERISVERDTSSDRRLVRGRELRTIRQVEPLARDTKALNRSRRSTECRQTQLANTERTQRNVHARERRTTSRDNSAQVVRFNRQRNAVERDQRKLVQRETCTECRINMHTSPTARQLQDSTSGVRADTERRINVRDSPAEHQVRDTALDMSNRIQAGTERRINVRDSLVTRQVRDTASGMSNRVRAGEKRQINIRYSLAARQVLNTDKIDRKANERRSMAARSTDERRMDEVVRVNQRHLPEKMERVRDLTDFIQHYERLPAKILTDSWTLQLVQFLITCALLAQVSRTKKANDNIFTRFVPLPMFSQLVKEKVQ